MVTLVCHPHAAQTANVELTTTEPCAHVPLECLVPHQIVVLNARLIPIAHQIELALVKNVRTHVSVLVDLMPCVTFKITNRFVLALRAMKEILTRDAMPSNVSTVSNISFLSQMFLFNFMHIIFCEHFHLVHPIEIYRPCNPSPCGANALCKENNGAGSCTCMPNYYGDPYISCRPECIQNSDCERNRACVNTKCVDPCIGACGSNAECRALFHSPHCQCLSGYTGDAIQRCYKIETSKLQFLTFPSSGLIITPIRHF